MFFNLHLFSYSTKSRTGVQLETSHGNIPELNILSDSEANIEDESEISISWMQDISHRSSTPLPTTLLSKTFPVKSPLQQRFHSQSLLEMFEDAQEIEKGLQDTEKMVKYMACSGDGKEDQNMFKMIRRTRRTRLTTY